MSAYQVLARKWRPQRFEEVVGQRGVTQTLRNAITTGRIAHSFVFSGPRGVGKTTTARILARGLNCVNGPTPDPCGICDACVEIAQGRDIDVLEIDAATNTQVDKVREVIIAGLGMVPVRNRYKIFLIDEVHRLSQQAFDALLKSIEEPPPHVVFMMATTELEKVPATIQSRSQVFELKTIGIKPIADQLRRIADAERIEVDDATLMLLARAGDGSMRDAESAFDQVIAFAGNTIAADDVTTVLGLVRRDLLLDIAEAVAAEDASAAFDLSAAAVESGYDLRLVIRELARLTRDLLVIRIDASRVNDSEIAADAERDRLKALATMFSAEDLMRAFEVLTKAEYDIKASMQPRYQLEIALLRWIHLRRLVPLTDLLQSVDTGSPAPVPQRAAGSASAATVRAIEARRSQPTALAGAQGGVRVDLGRLVEETEVTGQDQHGETKTRRTDEGFQPPPMATSAPTTLKDAFLAELQKTKKYFHGTVIAQAQRIDVESDRIVLIFAPQHRALRQQLDQMRSYLEELASRVAGRKMTVAGVEAPASPAPAQSSGASCASDGSPDRQSELRQQALADSGVQAMLDVFSTEIKEVEEM